MRAPVARQLGAVGKQHDQALEAFVVERRARLIEDAEAPNHLIEPLELAGEHAERTGRAGLGAANDVALEEQLSGLLGLRDATEGAQSDYRCGHKFHELPLRATMRFLLLVTILPVTLDI